MKFTLTINLDEIDEKIDKGFSFIKETKLNKCELRKINGKNIALFDEKETEKLKRHLEMNSIIPLSIASPIFKWNISNSLSKLKIDDYGVGVDIDDCEKEKIFDTIMYNAIKLDIKYIRIFSGLDKNVFIEKETIESRLIKKMLDNKNITFLLENEPVCYIKTKQDIIDLVDLIEKKKYSNIGIWLDIANFIRINERIDEQFVERIAPHIHYLHVKDFIRTNDSITYVPVGKGVVNYQEIFNLLNKYIADTQEIIVSVETHAPIQKKYDYSKESINYIRKHFGGLIKNERI